MSVRKPYSASSPATKPSRGGRRHALDGAAAVADQVDVDVVVDGVVGRGTRDRCAHA